MTITSQSSHPSASMIRDVNSQEISFRSDGCCVWQHWLPTTDQRHLPPVGRRYLQSRCITFAHYT